MKSKTIKPRQAISLQWDGEKLSILDQQLLPDREEWLEVSSPVAMIKMIKNLKVRGAPLIGVAAALSLALWSEKASDFDEFKKVAEELKQARPTAVNLMNCIDHLIKVAEAASMDIPKIQESAFALFDQDVELCQKMAEVGAKTIADGDRILTHCNTGGLATVGAGTALGVIKQAHAEGKDIQVFVDETRPLLQGGRLTTWELEKAGVPYELVCDNMAGWLMSEGRVDKIFVGSDRIAANGDFANKIGTYSLAVLADYHNVPFYVVAPQTTLDFACLNGKDIPVEMRKPEEVKGAIGHFGTIRWAPEAAKVVNPAFDITPAPLVTGYVIDDVLLDSRSVQTGGLKVFSP